MSDSPMVAMTVADWCDLGQVSRFVDELRRVSRFGEYIHAVKYPGRENYNIPADTDMALAQGAVIVY